MYYIIIIIIIKRTDLFYSQKHLYKLILITNNSNFIFKQITARIIYFIPFIQLNKSLFDPGSAITFDI